MNFLRKLPSAIVQATRSTIAIPKTRSTNPFAKSYDPQTQGRHSNWDNIAALSVPLEQYPRYRKTVLSDTNGRKRTRDHSEEDRSNAKRRSIGETTNSGKRSDSFYEAKRNFVPGSCNKKRARDPYDDDDYSEAKRFRSEVTLPSSSIQYAIKQPSQYSDPNRKVLENLLDLEITAEGWKKKSDGIEYHTEIGGKVFYETGKSIDAAREHVAVAALKRLRNFKRQNVFWPNQLLPFQLDQAFADRIERMVKTKFDEIMQRDQRYKPHKVLAGIVMTNGMSLDNAKVVAIGTGTKCIANVNEDEDGMVLHDMHAEVLARRSFVRFLYDQLGALLKEQSSIFQFEGKDIRLKDELKFHLYVNAIPCGDARIFSLPGLIHVKTEARMGSLRYKQIGGTEPITENTCRISSLSCSDKIARWNVLGLQGSHLAKLIKPIYLQSIVLGSAYKPIHMYRAIGGRLATELTDLPSGYCLNLPHFESTSLVETQNITPPSLLDHGVSWSYRSGDQRIPEILNLHTGMTIRGEKSTISKISFLNTFKSINQKLPVRSDEGIEKFRQVKEKFFSALKKSNLGAWEKASP